MGYFVYILKSTNSVDYYKGFTENPENRLIQHNSDECKTTVRKGPWEMVYLKEFATKRDALIEERRIKKLNRFSLEKLITSDSNNNI
ncbi:MAG: GIY-YIG nuclease family protein [Sphingobacteriales bacterium]|nr:GIY-YIG nuclease family protein [Sphingobacteriales bacterium]